MSVQLSSAYKNFLSIKNSVSNQYKALDSATQKRVEAAAAIALGAVSFQFGGWLAVGAFASANLAYIGVKKLGTWCKTRTPIGEQKFLVERRTELLTELVELSNEFEILDAKITEIAKRVTDEVNQHVTPPAPQVSNRNKKITEIAKRVTDEVNRYVTPPAPQVSNRNNSLLSRFIQD